MGPGGGRGRADWLKERGIRKGQYCREKKEKGGKKRGPTGGGGRIWQSASGGKTKDLAPDAVKGKPEEEGRNRRRGKRRKTQVDGWKVYKTK